MSTETVSRNNLIGASCAVLASFCFSTNDMAIKFLSSGYALHQVVLIRTTIALIFTLAILVPLEGGLSILKTRRLGIHILRGACVVVANMSFFLGLAAMPLAEAVAIFFVSPLIITAFSVIFLKERVGPRRWAAVGFGLLGALVIVRPGTAAFQFASLLPIAAAFAYATLHVLTRKIGVSERAATMAFYIQVTFIFVSSGIGLAVGDGRYADQSDPSLAFFFRAWVWPDAGDYGIFLLVGLVSALGGYFISQAYRVSEAGLAAPFEYVALPLSVMWGVVVFGEWPDHVAWLGIGMILAAGLYLFWRETVKSRAVAGKRPQSLR